MLLAVALGLVAALLALDGPLGRALVRGYVEVFRNTPLLIQILIKDTSLAAITGVFELTRAAQESIERTLRPFELYLTAAAIYFCLCFPMSLLAGRAERRLQRP